MRQTQRRNHNCLGYLYNAELDEEIACGCDCINSKGISVHLSKIDGARDSSKSIKNAKLLPAAPISNKAYKTKKCC
ncbi:hypothetical protein Bca4012_025564 [Brassica carinata]